MLWGGKLPEWRSQLDEPEQKPMGLQLKALGFRPVRTKKSGGSNS